MKIRKFKDFKVNEIHGLKQQFHRQINPVVTKSPSRVDACVMDLLDFLKSNEITTWDQFLNMTPFSRFTVNQLIDSNCEGFKEVEEVRYKMRLKLSNIEELKNMIREFEEMEEFEKCAEIQKEIQSRK